MLILYIRESVLSTVQRIFASIAVSVEKATVYSTALAFIMLQSPFGWSYKKLQNESTLQTSIPHLKISAEKNSFFSKGDQ